MDWQWPLIAYLTIGILLGEGLIYHGKKTATEVSVAHYLIALLLGPVVVWVVIVLMALRKRPK